MVICRAAASGSSFEPPSSAAAARIESKVSKLAGRESGSRGDAGLWWSPDPRGALNPVPTSVCRRGICGGKRRRGGMARRSRPIIGVRDSPSLLSSSKSARSGIPLWPALVSVEDWVSGKAGDPYTLADGEGLGAGLPDCDEDEGGEAVVLPRLELVPPWASPVAFPMFCLASRELYLASRTARMTSRESPATLPWHLSCSSRNFEYLRRCSQRLTSSIVNDRAVGLRRSMVYTRAQVRSRSSFWVDGWNETKQAARVPYVLCSSRMLGDTLQGILFPGLVR